MCERCEAQRSIRLIGRRDRLKLWSVARQYHCAIVGTCFGPDDVAWLARRLNLTGAEAATPYDIHRTLVGLAGSAGPAAKLMTKRLDAKSAAEIRRFAGETTEAGWLALWDAAMASGTVAAAFWAVLGHGGVPDELRARVYGDVHMLSHLMGGENRRNLRENQELTRRCADLEARLARAERLAADRLAAREARVAALAADLAAEQVARRAAERLVAAPRPAACPALARGNRLEREAEALRRRVSVERARARRAEAELDRVRCLIDEAGAPVVSMNAAAQDAGAERNGNLRGRAILYVGGRQSLLPHMRAVVEARNGSLLHHDGGVEKTVRCLEGLVERADVIVCPVDCVSHDACLHVKGLCRRLRKPFVPIRSAGASTFARVVDRLGHPAAGAC